MRKIFSFIVIASFVFSTSAYADKSKEFFTSVIYGTLAGTLVGAATLAFTTSPGDNLNNVARGASYGLYAGILLGLYVTYALDDSPDENKKNNPGDENSTPNQDGDNSNQQGIYKKQPAHKIQLAFKPYFLIPDSTNQAWGGGAQFLEVKF